MACGRLQYRINPKLQMRAENILKAQGITPSLAITIFYTEVTKKRGFPFLPSEVPNEELAKTLEEVDNGIGVRSYKDFDEMIDDLENPNENFEDQ